MGIFDEHAENGRKEVILEVSYDRQARWQDPGSNAEDLRLASCLAPADVNGRDKAREPFWLLDITQAWLGQPKNEEPALFAMNRVVLSSQVDNGRCDIPGKGACVNELGDTEPNESEDIECFGASR
jgi:hypothetical protein